jgi:hypothetical protein
MRRQTRRKKTDEIDNRETYPPQDLIKWMKKEESMNRQQRWERGDNEIGKHQQAGRMTRPNSAEKNKFSYPASERDIPGPTTDTKSKKLTRRTAHSAIYD